MSLIIMSFTYNLYFALQFNQHISFHSFSLQSDMRKNLPAKIDCWLFCLSIPGRSFMVSSSTLLLQKPAFNRLNESINFEFPLFYSIVPYYGFGMECMWKMAQWLESTWWDSYAKLYISPSIIITLSIRYLLIISFLFAHRSLSNLKMMKKLSALPPPLSFWFISFCRRPSTNKFQF